MMAAPQYHAISGLPPFELFDDYMSPKALATYHLEQPSTWTTVTGLLEDVNSGLCLGGKTMLADKNAGE